MAKKKTKAKYEYEKCGCFVIRRLVGSKDWEFASFCYVNSGAEWTPCNDPNLDEKGNYNPDTNPYVSCSAEEAMKLIQKSNDEMKKIRGELKGQMSGLVNQTPRNRRSLSQEGK